MVRVVSPLRASGSRRRRRRAAAKEVGFNGWDTVEAPGRVGEFLDDVDFGRCFRCYDVVELLAVELVGGGIFGRQDRGLAGEAVRRALREERCLPDSVRWPVDC